MKMTAFSVPIARLLCMPIFCSVATALPPIPIPSWHGINIHFINPLPGEAQAISNAGFDMVRRDFEWAAIENVERGIYNFTIYDALVTSLGQTRALFILDYGNPLYDGGNPPTSEAAVAAFVAWASASVTHFAGAGHIWEMWNEPNIPACAGVGSGATASHENLGGWAPCANATSYAALALATAKAIKANHPGELLVGPGMAQLWNGTVLGPDYAFLDTAAAAGLLDLWDGVSIHPYRPGPPHAPEDSLVEYSWMWQWLQINSPPTRRVGLVNSECGWSTATIPPNGSPLANETVQAMYTSRQRLVDVLGGVNVSISYDFKDDGVNDSYIEDRFGLLREQYYNASYPHDQKPAWIAAATLHTVFAGCGIVGGVAQSVVGHDGTEAACYTAYYDCGFISPAFAAWCNAPLAWSGNMTFPYTWPAPPPTGWAGEYDGWTQMYEGIPTLLHQAARVQTPPQPTSAGPCFYLYTMLGVNTGLVCSTGSDPSTYFWAIEGGAAPVYLRDVQVLPVQGG